ncbi:MAG TPA: TIGR00730 family Rossman fold protein [Hyphomicrobiales bacterium]|nr:TIGR00730 family Rossman fold protein [Hyphomicrobiales bacterium]
MKNNGVKNVCVYCGSNDGAHPVYVKAAQAFGKILGDNGIGLVYGGASVGLMGYIARATLEAGGHVTGIVPENLPAKEVPFAGVQELIEVKTFHERKMLMFERSDAFVALPGGVGTLEELVEQITWVQLSHHDKPVVIADIDGYWQPLIQLFDQMRKLGFINSGLDINYHTASKAGDILPIINKAYRKKPDSTSKQAFA